MSEFTPKYNLEKPSQDDFYDVDVHNKNMERIEEQLSLNEEAVKNMDVSASITNVINERVNADTSKPLSTLISEWVNAAKTAILNGINGLPQKSVWTDARGAKLDNLNQSITTTQTNINDTVNSARDSIKSHVTTLSERKILRPSSAKKYTVIGTTEKSCPAYSIIGRWTAPYNGVVQVTCTGRSVNGYKKYVYLIISDSTDNSDAPDARWFMSAVGATLGNVPMGKKATVLYLASEGQTLTRQVSISVRKGDILCFISKSDNGGDVPIVKDMYICYDEVTL